MLIPQPTPQVLLTVGGAQRTIHPGEDFVEALVGEPIELVGDAQLEVVEGDPSRVTIAKNRLTFTAAQRAKVRATAGLVSAVIEFVALEPEALARVHVNSGNSADRRRVLKSVARERKDFDGTARFLAHHAISLTQFGADHQPPPGVVATGVGNPFEVRR